MSALALFVALGGVGYATTSLGGPPAQSITSLMIQNDSIASKDIRDGTILGRDISNQSIGSVLLKNRTIRVKDLADSTVEALAGDIGPTGPAGETGSPGPQGPEGPAGESAVSSLKSGERIYGTYGLQGQGPYLWTGVTFPVPAPTPVDSLHVVIANNDTVSGDGCTGSTTDPVSAPGYVCIYTHMAINTTAGYGWGVRCACGDATATGDGSRFGFMVQAVGPSGQLLTANGVWAYTAP